MRTALAVLLLALPALAQRRAPKKPELPPQHGPVRIDMETQDVKGQRNAYGAVQLYDRKQLAPRSMVKTPDNFRSEISY